MNLKRGIKQITLGSSCSPDVLFLFVGLGWFCLVFCVCGFFLLFFGCFFGGGWVGG